MNKHAAYDLKQMQMMSLDAKIRMSQQRITQWYEYWDGQVYVSFSGGKDSTVLLHLVRSLYPDVEAVYVDTGLEFPELRNHVKTFKNVTWLKPEMNFKEVILTYGYPVISKEVAQIIKEARIGLEREDGSYAYRIKKLNGELINPHTGELSPFNCKQWKFMLNAPFKISDECCKVMKKKPIKKYEKMTGKKSYIGTMATESRLRKQRWIRYGCNSFEKGKQSSNPLSFWTEQDIFEYIKKYNLVIPSVYGDIVETGKKIERIDGIHNELRTTGCKRTGCMFCAFGAHCKGDTRFLDLKETHPKVYEYCMKPVSEGGLGMDEVLDYIGVQH